MLFGIVRSIAITATVSSAVGGIFWALDGNFWKPFVLATVIQFVIFWMFTTVMDRISLFKQKQIENDRIAEFSKQSIEAECSYCKTLNLIPLQMDRDNDFDCTNCGKPNAVYIGVTVTQKTTPLNVSSLAINTLNPDEQSAIDKITNG